MFVQLYAPKSYWHASDAERNRVCNGCGTKGLGGWLVPDTLYGLNIEICCDIHDWMYCEGSSVADKERADRTFLNNMLRLIEAKSFWMLLPLRRYRAMLYYSAVCDFGGPAFWNGKNLTSEFRTA